MHKRGDTLIEVMFAVAVFGLGAVGAIALMNTGLASIQNSLETTMARQEIDAQAEALRFIHGAYLTEPDTKETNSSGETVSTNNFRNLWKTIISSAYPASTVDTSGHYSSGVVAEDPNFFTRTVGNKSNCDSLFTTQTSNGSFGIPKQSFVINPRGLNLLTAKTIDPSGNSVTKVLTDTDIRQNIFISSDDAISGAAFTTAATYPRLLYGVSSTDGESLSDALIENDTIKYKNATMRLDRSEGIWVTAITSKSGLQCYDENGNPEGSIRPDFYDFHIQTCWDSVGGNASVISSTVRLFNPDQVSLKKQGMITFDNVEWEKYDNVAHSGSTCGPEVDADKHTQASGTDIEFTGYTADNMDEGVRFSIADRLYFTLDVDVDTSGILTHPGGEGLTITIGPIKANLTDHGGSITGTIEREISSKNFHLQMTRAGNEYRACAGEICVEATSTDYDVSIDYNFKHSGHCCAAISRATLSNIEMNSTTEDESSGGCVKVTATPPANPEPIVPTGGGSSGGPGTPPAEPEPNTYTWSIAKGKANTVTYRSEYISGDSSATGSGAEQQPYHIASSSLDEDVALITPSYFSCDNTGSSGTPDVKCEDFLLYPNTKAGTFVYYYHYEPPNVTIDTPFETFMKKVTASFRICDGILYNDPVNCSSVKLTVEGKDAIDDSQAGICSGIPHCNSATRYWIVGRGELIDDGSGINKMKFTVINKTTNRDPSNYL